MLIDSLDHMPSLESDGAGGISHTWTSETEQGLPNACILNRGDSTLKELKTS